jgi:hypothetical protein
MYGATIGDFHGVQCTMHGTSKHESDRERSEMVELDICCLSETPRGNAAPLFLRLPIPQIEG